MDASAGRCGRWKFHGTVDGIFAVRDLEQEFPRRGTAIDTVLKLRRSSRR